MEFPQQVPDSKTDQDTAEVNKYAGPGVSLCARLWEYRGPQEKLAEFDWGVDDAIANLIREVLSQGQGKITELRGNSLVSHFDNPFNALNAAKSLQVRLLTLHRAPQGSQMIAAVMVFKNEAGAPSATPANASDPLLAEVNSAQILVSAGIYEAAKLVPGFQFGTQPSREPGANSEALYELLWTDESTYSHVRKVGQVEQPGSSNANRYQIQSELGRGAMGVVYKAIDNVIGRTVALKTISIQRNFADRDELVERLKLEAKAAGGLDHPNIITIFDVGQDKEFVYLSMQFVEGQTLAAMIDEGKLPPLATLLSFVDQICSAVGFAHQRGVIHRDLKPANFMITGDGAVKVLDFGIAKLGDATVTQTGVVVGTPTYMAPEQATGKKLDQRSDIFALGTVFYELFTREKPFKGDIAAILYKLIHEDPTPPSIINPSLPTGIDRIIRKALAKNPADRYQSCEEMREAFRDQTAFLQSMAVMQSGVPAPAGASTMQARPPSSTKNRIVVPAKRSSSGSAWFGVLTLIVTAVAAVGLWAVRAKSQTGSFPAGVQKAIAATRNLKTHGLERSAASTESAVAPQASDAPAATVNTSIVPGATSDSKESAQDTTATVSTSAASPSPSPVPNTNGAVAQAPADSAPVPQLVSTPPSVAGAKSSETPAVEVSETKSSPPAASDANQNEASPTESTTPKPAKHEAKRVSTRAVEENVHIDGFSRSDVPDLLRKADAASGAGDYSLALYEYNLVLKLDHHNSAAHAGIARATAAKQEKLH